MGFNSSFFIPLGACAALTYLPENKKLPILVDITETRGFNFENSDDNRLILQRG